MDSDYNTVEVVFTEKSAAKEVDLNQGDLNQGMLNKCILFIYNSIN